MAQAITQCINSVAGSNALLDFVMVTATKPSVPLLFALVAAQWWSKIDRPQHVIRRDVLLQVEAVEQRFLHHRPFTHHCRHSLGTDTSESGRGGGKREFFNTIKPYADKSAAP